MDIIRNCLLFERPPLTLLISFILQLFGKNYTFYICKTVCGVSLPAYANHGGRVGMEVYIYGLGGEPTYSDLLLSPNHLFKAPKFLRVL